MANRSALVLSLVALTGSTIGHPPLRAQAGAGIYTPGVNYRLPSVVVSSEDIGQTKATMIAQKTLDVPIRMVDAGGHRVGVSLVYREVGGTQAPVIHDRVSEVYQILEGSGTLLTGGTLVNPQRRPESGGNGPGIAGAGLDGGTSRTLKKGDIVIIPAGTPHKWASVEEFMTYTVIRMDPDRIVPLK